jgi:hypothetical protein
MGDTKSDAMFRAGDYEGASKRLREGLEEEGLDGRDGLLYLLDLGLSLHSAGKYDESTKVFRQADQLAEIKDYTSLSAEAATLLTSDQIKQYRGEDFENVLINVYLAMNYALIGKHEDALVESRRVNRKLYLMTTEGKRKYKQNAFARYLAAILYEADKNWNDAYVDYKLAADLIPGFPGIGKDLWAIAWKRKDREDLEKWRTKYKLTDADIEEAKKRVSSARPAEIIVLFENGISPKKVPHPNFYSVPKFVPRLNPVTSAEVTVSGPAGAIVRGKTQMLMDIESVAIQNLDEKWGGLLAKKLAGIVAKESIGNVVDSKTGNQGIGALVKLALYISDQADTRSWNLLPKDLQIARILVSAGTHTVQVQPVGAAGPLPGKTVQAKAGEKVFVDFRYMP